MKFKNIKTGNVVSTDNKTVIEMMQKSERYEPVTETAKSGKGTAGKQDSGAAE